MQDRIATLFFKVPWIKSYGSAINHSYIIELRKLKII
jgi:hypothetical protein